MRQKIEYDYDNDTKTTIYKKRKIAIIKKKCEKPLDYFYKYCVLNLTTKKIIDTYYLNH